MIGVWHWFGSIFATTAPGTNSGQHSLSQDDAGPATVGKLAIDAAARNALLEIHFGDIKDRRSPRRFAGSLHILNR
jgi:hypothetical protein